MYLVICFVLYPYLFFLLPFVLLLFVLLLKFALVASVESIRQDALSRSPINSLFSSTLESLITIRAYNQQTSLNDKFQDLVDSNGRAFFTFLAVSRWIGFQIDNIGILWVTGLLLLSFFSASHDSAPSMALAITSCLAFLAPL